MLHSQRRPICFVFFLRHFLLHHSFFWQVEQISDSGTESRVEKQQRIYCVKTSATGSDARNEENAKNTRNYFKITTFWMIWRRRAATAKAKADELRSVSRGNNEISFWIMNWNVDCYRYCCCCRRCSNSQAIFWCRHVCEPLLIFIFSFASQIRFERLAR